MQKQHNKKYKRSENMYLEILFTIATAIFTYIFINYLVQLSKLKDYPPGPIPLPLIGSIHLLGGFVPSKFKELSKKYGDVFTITLGSKRTVVINAIEPAKEALIQKGVDFAGRPNDIYTLELLTRGYRDLVMSDYGTLWKILRKVAHSSLKMYGAGLGKLETLILKETEEFLGRLNDRVGQSFDPSIDIGNTVVNIMCAIVFGSRYDINDKEFLQVMEYNRLMAEGGAATDAIAFFPWLRYFPMKSLKAGLDKMVRSNAIRDPILKRKLDEHRATLTPGIVRDFTDAVLNSSHTELKENEQNLKYLTDDHLQMVMNDIFAAGVESSVTSLRWTFVYLCNFPQVQDRMYEELKKVVGNDRLPTLQDRGHLPFLEATIHEVQRRSSLIPLGVPHKTTCNTSLQGYNIPKDTQILFNHYAIHNDERHWEKPDEFRPERWLDENANFVPGAHSSYLPFSAGRRVCLGEALAKSELFIIVARLMFRYKIVKAPNKQLPSMDGNMGITFAPCNIPIAIVHRDSI